ncbi:MAG TPA: carboxypeptidase-like regulatory domain-containing protein [Methylomirabilota bacterium]
MSTEQAFDQMPLDVDTIPSGTAVAPEPLSDQESRKESEPGGSGLLRTPLSRLQAVIGIAAGVLSISGALVPTARMLNPGSMRGEVVAVVQDGRLGTPVSDATIEVLTPENAVVTTLKPDANGRVRFVVKEGRYRVAVTHARFPVEKRHIQVMAGQASEVRFRLVSRATPETGSTLAAAPKISAGPAPPPATVIVAPKHEAPAAAPAATAWPRGGRSESP